MVVNHLSRQVNRSHNHLHLVKDQHRYLNLLPHLHFQVPNPPGFLLHQKALLLHLKAFPPRQKALLPHHNLNLNLPPHPLNQHGVLLRHRLHQNHLKYVFPLRLHHSLLTALHLQSRLPSQFGTALHFTTPLTTTNSPSSRICQDTVTWDKCPLG